MIQFKTEEGKWSWLAGLIDCDGCIKLSKYHDPRRGKVKKIRSTSWLCYVTFVNVNKEIVETFNSLMGRKGKIYTIRSKIKNHRTCYRSDCMKVHLREVLPKIFPYLVVKKKQCEIMMEVIKILDNSKVGERNYEELDKYYKMIKKLNNPNGKKTRKRVRFSRYYDDKGMEDLITKVND